jgi:glycosyltransferase involved in cell wall biosynthesis
MLWKEICAFKREWIFMKVTILSNSKGGVFTVTMQWAKGLIRKGCDVNIFFLTQSKEAKCLVPSERIRFHYVTTSNFLPNLRAIFKFLFHDRSDVIHTNFASLGLLAIFKKYMFKTPFIFTLHGIPEPWLQLSLSDKVAYTIEYYLLPFVTSQSSAVVAVSKYVKDMLKRRYNVDSEVIYHGVDANTFKPRNKAQSKRELGYEETDFVVLFIGKLHPYKDPLTLIKAFSEAVKKNTNLCLAMIGEGELYQEVNKKISELNLLNRVKLFRRVSDERLKILYNAADLFVLPSVGEAFGMTLLEAMASGVPVIASNSGACLEVVGNAGILFSRGNHIELAEKILRLSHEKELSRKLSEAGMKRVRETFSWEDKIDQYLKLYKIACLSKFK